MNMSDFAQPYLGFLLGAAFSIQQTLEGLGLSSSTFLVTDAAGKPVDSYMSATEAVAVPFLVILACAATLAVLVVAATGLLFRRRGAIVAAVLLLMPGALSLLGVMPLVTWTPSVYQVGAGYPGAPVGMLALVTLALSTGWVSVIGATKLFRLGDRFRHGYDQLWYALAVAAGVFFVADVDSSRQRDKLLTASSEARGAATYLLAQVRRMEQACRDGSFRSELGCAWATGYVQQKLVELATYGERLYWQLGPDSSARLYEVGIDSSLRIDSSALRDELQRYNYTRCPVTNHGGGMRTLSKVSRECEAPPPAFCQAFPDEKPGDAITINMLVPVALANECVVPTLVRQTHVQTRLFTAVSDVESARHLRWLFYLVVAALAGGKVANATVRMVAAGQQTASPPSPSSPKHISLRSRLAQRRRPSRH